MYKSKNDMSYEQVKAIMLEHGLEEYDDSEGTNFRFVKGKNHIKIFERFKPMIRGGITGNLYVEVLDDYKTQCSKNGHINIKHVQDEKELRNILGNVKEYYLRKKCPNGATVNKLNSIILGVHNYYKTATNVNLDMSKINFLVLKSLDIRFRTMIKDNPKYTDTYIELYGKYKGKARTIAGITIYPIYGCTTSPPMNFIQGICNYTERGRILVHTKLKGYNHLIEHLLKNCDSSKSAEYFDNRISLIVGQQGRCGVTGLPLEIDSMECHHKQSKALGGVDKYDNLIWVSYEIHKLIHSAKQDTINKYLGKISLNKKQFRKLNSLRLQVGNSVI